MIARIARIVSREWSALVDTPPVIATQGARKCNTMEPGETSISYMPSVEKQAPVQCALLCFSLVAACLYEDVPVD